jgi:hypothetical protein
VLSKLLRLVFKNTNTAQGLTDLSTNLKTARFS